MRTGGGSIKIKKGTDRMEEYLLNMDMDMDMDMDPARHARSPCDADIFPLLRSLFLDGYRLSAAQQSAAQPARGGSGAE